MLQFYPSSDDQIQLITSIAQRAGFGGGLVVDYPNSKRAKKVFLCLFVGGGGGQQSLPKGLEGQEGQENDETVKFEKRRERERRKEKSGKRKGVKDRDWILKKKDVSIICPFVVLSRSKRSTSFTGDGVRRMSPVTQSTQAANEKLYSKL